MADRPPFDQEDELKRSKSLLHKITTLYSQAHKDIVSLFDFDYFERARLLGLKPRGSSSLLRTGRLIYAFDRRIDKLNSSLLSAYDTFKGPFARSISLQIAREVVQLGLTDTRVLPTSTDVVQRRFNDSFKAMVRWNRLIRPQLSAVIRVATSTADDYDTLKEIVATEDKLPSGLTSPIGKARSHALANTRYAVVSAANEAREDTLNRIDKRDNLGIKKMWWAQIDTACISCAKLHGRIVDLGDQFDWEPLGLLIHPFTGHLFFPPLHVNCYCRIIPVTDEILSSTDLGSIATRRNARVKTLASIL